MKNRNIPSKFRKQVTAFKNVNKSGSPLCHVSVGITTQNNCTDCRGSDVPSI